MTGSLLDRVLHTLELLSANAEGLTLHSVAERLAIPKSAAHRLLAELIGHGYVRHEGAGRYVPTAKVLSLGYAWRSSRQVGPRIQPILDRLAAETGELVRYASVDGESLAWIAAAQGARFGLKVDPDDAFEAALPFAAAGHAWLAFQTEQEALRLAQSQDLVANGALGPNAPRTPESLLQRLSSVRQRGFAVATDSLAPGVAEIAVPVRRPGETGVIGVLEVLGPSIRLTEARMDDLAEALAATAEEIGLVAADTLPVARQPAAADALPAARKPVASDALPLARQAGAAEGARAG